MSQKLTQLVTEFFEIVEKVETNDDGHEFHPTRITSCRVMDTEQLRKLIPQIKEELKNG